MITKYIKLQGYINRSTVQELCGFTDQQARRTIEKMKEENIIEMSNGGRYFKRNLICYSTWQCRVRERVKMSVKTKISKCVALSWHFNLSY